MPEQIALIELPVWDITARTRFPFQDLGEIEVLGQRCQVLARGHLLEFALGARQFEVSLDELAATVAAAISAQLRSERAAGAPRRAEAAPPRAEERAEEMEDDGFVTVHPSVRRTGEPLP